MRQLGVMTLSLALLGVVEISTSLAADLPAPTPEAPPSIPLYRRIFLGERNKPVPPPVATPAPAATPKPTPKTVDTAAQTLAEEQKVFLQRLAVLTKFKQIALDTNDEAMMRRIEELEEQAEKVFSQRTAGLPGPRSNPNTAIPSSTLEEDTASLERRPDTGKTPSATRTPSRNSRPVREVNP